MTKEMQELESQLLPRQNFPEFWPGDEISVSIAIKEGEKERIQIFTGTVIAKKGSHSRETFTVRKFSYGEGVERVFPFASPLLRKIEVLKTRQKKGIAARAKMYYMRDLD